MHITINNEDYTYAKFKMLKKSLCYKLNGVGINLYKKGLRKKFLGNNSILKIVIAAYKKKRLFRSIESS